MSNYVFFLNFHSQKNVQETQTLLKSQSDPDDMLKELQVMRNDIIFVFLVINCIAPSKHLNVLCILQNIVDFAKNIPLVDDEIFHMPTFIASTLMTRVCFIRILKLNHYYYGFETVNISIGTYIFLLLLLL